MKIVIIGYTGFIGENIFNYLKNNNEHHLCGISTKEIDLTKEASHLALSKQFSKDCVVIMCAGVKKQLGDNFTTFEKNLVITKNFLKAISLSPPQKIIYFSSASIYGEDVFFQEKITEETPVQLKTYYGIAKYTTERLIEKTCAEFKTKILILRPPLIYGKDDFSKGYGPTGFTYKALSSEEIILWGDGSEFREFIYIDDVVMTIDLLIRNDYSGTLNLVSGDSYAFEEIILILEKTLGKKLIIKSKKRSKDKVDHHYSNKLFQKVIKELQFNSLEKGIIKMLKSIQD